MAHLDDIREFLRLGPDSQLEEITHVPAPQGLIAEGLVAPSREPIGLDTATQDALRGEPHFSLDEALASSLGAAVERWDANPAIVAIHGDVDVVDDAGHVAELLGRWIIDTRAEGGAVLIRHDTRSIAVMGRNGAVTVAAVVSQSPRVVPEAHELLGAGDAPPWLLSKTRNWSRGALVDQVASIGLIGRLATALTNDPKATVNALLAGNPTPTSAARDAASALPHDVLRSVASDALARCRSLRMRMTSRPSDVSAEAASFWHDLATDRDKLESAAWVLAEFEDCEPLRAALIELDREIAMHLSEFEANAEDIDNPHLSAVSWQEPEHWWGVRR